MSEIFLFIKNINKIIPIIKKLIGFISSYIKEQAIKSINKKDKAAIRKAIDEQDQRDLEKQLGNTHSGEMSNTPGTSLRDGLPSVVQKPDKG